MRLQRSLLASTVRAQRFLAVRWRGFGAMALLASLAACAVTTGVGVGYEGDDYVGGFYEPYGYDYGGWGGGYRVGPRWGDRGHGGDGRGGPGPGRGPGGDRPYHAAPPSRGMPSIPHGPRGH